MLATILKGERAEKTTLAIIDTFVQVREPMEQRAESHARMSYPEREPKVMSTAEE